MAIKRTIEFILTKQARSETSEIVSLFNEFVEASSEILCEVSREQETLSLYFAQYFICLKICALIWEGAAPSLLSWVLRY